MWQYSAGPAMTDAALPPAELAGRVGSPVGGGSYDAYETVGRQLHDVIVTALPPNWTWPGKRVLDFGCGAGRTLRHFTAEAAEASFEGCDIDRLSIDWLNAHLNPPFQGFVNDEAPPLPRPDDNYDLVWALSVFTHIADLWSAWLLELHRVLVPGGILVASFMGAGMSETVAGESWDDTRIGMNILKAHQGWDMGGPVVLMSPWWIREHWGRAFNIVALHEGASPGTHGLIVAHAKEEPPSSGELERVDGTEPREVAALRHNIRQLQRESAALGASLANVESSRSWRIAAALRRLRDRLTAYVPM